MAAEKKVDDRLSNASTSSDEDDSDQDWGDWVDDDGANAAGNAAGGLHIAQGGSPSGGGNASRTVYHALFADEDPSTSAGVSKGQAKLRAFATAKEALEHADQRGCNLPALIRRCQLDALQVIRLLNYLRRRAVAGDHVDPKQIAQLSGTEFFLDDDKELHPVEGYTEDGLLQIDFDDLDSELGGDEEEHNSTSAERRRIAELESQLRAAQLAVHDMRQRLLERLGLQDSSDSSSEEEDDDAFAVKGKGRASSVKRKGANIASEDAHYFSSYASHDIHQTMISDKVRTLSYAKFLLAPENAHLIRGKTVMDVGCGSGILSMFAARAGAKDVIAIDASTVASRAEKNVRLNGLDGIITVYHARVEELDDILAEHAGKVDLIVSEWMGYFLLYESMLPAVLYARDRYLRPGGLLAPSHTRMLFSAVSDCSIVKERMGFWDNVHGFSMNAMRTGLADEAWTEMLQSNQIATSVDTMLELPLHTITAKQPSFTSPFALRVERDCTIQAFVSWFDTWFTPDGKPVPGRRAKNESSDDDHDDDDDDDSQIAPGKTLEGLPPVSTTCPEESEVRGLQLSRDSIVPKSSDIESRGTTISFTTSPFGPETHWKQTLFVLKEPIEAKKDSVIVGVIHSTPNDDNVRELDVEIHYSIREGSMPATGRRKSVEARTVQLFSVR